MINDMAEKGNSHIMLKNLKVGSNNRDGWTIVNTHTFLLPNHFNIYLVIFLG